MSSATKQVLTDLSPVLKVYTDGTVERFFNFPDAEVPLSPEDQTTGVSFKDATISPSLSARLFLPKLTAAKLVPILVYYHGGGFCLGSAFSSVGRTYLNIISAEAGALVVSVDYRIAPEHPLPAAYEDSWETLNWVCSHAALDQTDIQKDPWIADHGDFSRLFIAGDSAGGNIAHHMALRAGSEPLAGNVKIRGAILSHPYFMGSDHIGKESRENPNWALLEKMWALVYPSVPGGIDSPWINPLAEGGPSLSGMGCSRMQICVSEKDVLKDRAVAYAEEVKKSGWGGEVEVVEVEGEDHCFHVFDPDKSEKAMNLIKKMASFLSH